jgi:guanylate kinase
VTPRVVILSSPSGGGKTTITRALLERRGDVGYSVSATTRPPRAGEVDGAAYHFVTPAEFDRMIAAGEFLEWATYAEHRYGTLRREVERELQAGRHVVLDIEIDGARQVWDQCPPPRAIRVFILPPSGQGWVERLVGRETESPQSLARRAERAIWEIRQALAWEHVVINDDLDRAVGEVSQIIDEDGRHRHRPTADHLDRLVRELVHEAERLRHAD